MSAGTDSGYRRIEAGACTWCGHAPHDDACTSRIRAGAVNDRATYASCPCSKRATS